MIGFIFKLLLLESSGSELRLIYYLFIELNHIIQKNKYIILYMRFNIKFKYCGNPL